MAGNLICNPTLKGEKLLILRHWLPPQSFLDDLHKAHPDLVIRAHQLKPDEEDQKLPSDIWEDVTVILTYETLPPTKDAAPKLKYVQLDSAGCNHILDLPLFAETDIKLCTANGVHPYVILQLTVLYNRLILQAPDC